MIQQAIAILLMLGDDFTEREARTAFEEANIATNVSYLQMMGFVKHAGARLEQYKGRYGAMSGFVLTYSVTEKGKAVLA